MKKILVIVLLIIAAGIILWYNYPLQDSETKRILRERDINMIEHAAMQYIIDGYALKNIPEGKAAALDICIGADCDDHEYNLSALVPTYISATKPDSASENDLSDYRIYKEEGSINICDTDVDEDCGD